MSTSRGSPTCFAAGKKIIIAGGGIAGLAFAAALRRQWLSQPSWITPPMITLYERDPVDFGAEREGYSISVRSDANSTGMQALQKLGLLDTMLSQSITGIQKDPGTFCFGLSNGKIEVQLSSGRIDECDLLVAADGASSKIQSSFHPAERLSFTGTVSISGSCKFEDNIPSPVNRDWDLYLAGTGTGLFVSPMDEHNAIWSLSYLSSESTELTMLEDLREEALERGKDFAEPFQTLVKATDPATVGILNNKDRQPFPNLTGSLKGVPIVFIGDANHAVSPFAGAGANLALADGWDLAEQLCKFDSLSDALATYDALAIPRAKAVVRNSHFTIALAHASGWRFVLYTWLLQLAGRLFMQWH